MRCRCPVGGAAHLLPRAAPTAISWCFALLSRRALRRRARLLVPLESGVLAPKGTFTSTAHQQSVRNHGDALVRTRRHPSHVRPPGSSKLATIQRETIESGDQTIEIGPIIITKASFVSERRRCGGRRRAVWSESNLLQPSAIKQLCYALISPWQQESTYRNSIMSHRK